jgi:hypothetical protein
MNNQLAALAFAALTLAGSTALTASPVMAQDNIEAPAITGRAAMTPGSYEEPESGYESLAAYTRDVNGTPCGVNCERQWEATSQRW